MNPAELKQVTELCQRLGAPPAQAGTMAQQLLKRADQLAAEGKITREQAMARLLEVLVHGRHGEVPPERPAPAAPSH